MSRPAQVIKGTGTLEHPKIQCRFYPECIMCGWLDELEMVSSKENPQEFYSCQLLRPMILNDIKSVRHNRKKTLAEMAMVERGHCGGIDMVLNDWAHMQFARMMLERQAKNAENQPERPVVEEEPQEERELNQAEHEQQMAANNVARKEWRGGVPKGAFDMSLDMNDSIFIDKPQPEFVPSSGLDMSLDPNDSFFNEKKGNGTFDLSIDMNDSIFDVNPEDIVVPKRAPNHSTPVKLEEQFILEGAVDTVIDTLFDPLSSMRLKPLTETMNSPLRSPGDSGYQSRRESRLNSPEKRASPGGFTPPKVNEPKSRSTVAWGSIVEELGDSPQRRLSKTPSIELKDMSIRDAIVAANESIRSQLQENPQLATVVQNISSAESRLNDSWDPQTFHEWARSGGDLDPNVSWDPAIEHMRLRGILDESKQLLEMSIESVVEVNGLDEELDEQPDPVYLSQALNTAAEQLQGELNQSDAAQIPNTSGGDLDSTQESISYLDESTQSIMESLRTRGLQNISARQGILLDESLLDPTIPCQLSNPNEDLLNNTAYQEYHQRLLQADITPSASTYVNELLDNTAQVRQAGRMSNSSYSRGPKFLSPPLNESFNPSLNSTARFAERNSLAQSNTTASSIGSLNNTSSLFDGSFNSTKGIRMNVNPKKSGQAVGKIQNGLPTKKLQGPAAIVQANQSSSARRGSTLDQTLDSLASTTPEQVAAANESKASENTQRSLLQDAANESSADKSTDEKLNSTGWGNSILVETINLDCSVGELSRSVDEAEASQAESLLSLSIIRRQQELIHGEGEDGITIRQVNGARGILIEVNSNPTFINNASPGDHLLEKLADLVEKRHKQFEQHITEQLESRLDKLANMLAGSGKGNRDVSTQAVSTSSKLPKPRISLANLARTLTATKLADKPDVTAAAKNWGKVTRAEAFSRHIQPVYDDRKINLTRYRPRVLNPGDFTIEKPQSKSVAKNTTKLVRKTAFRRKEQPVFDGRKIRLNREKGRKLDENYFY